MIETKVDREKVILIGLDLVGPANRSPSDAPRATAEESMEELCTLAESARADIVDQVIQHRAKPQAATLLGSGKVEEIRALGQMHAADLAIVDYELTPTQQRNLEKALDLRVIDRTQLILDIFAARARTREGQLQVELAQLNYLLPRLTGRGIEMSRLGGGIGTRGPGETQLETDRRKIQRRIKGIEQGLEQVRSGRGIQRRQRQSVPLATIALVGYTNAGKSTLFNRVTGASVLADAKMFATLDPTVRHVTLPSNRRVLMSDTVGFIRNLPTTLVKAFRATLEEVTESELLLHIVDVTSLHATEQTAHVFKVLGEIGAQETPQILVLNKTDLLPDANLDVDTVVQRILGESGHTGPTRAIAVSAKTGEGIEALHALIDKTLMLDPVTPARFRMPAGEGGPLHILHEHARVLKTDYQDEWCLIEAEVPESIRRRLREYLVD